MHSKITAPNTRIKFVGLLNFDKVTNEMAAVTLGKGSRSIFFYGTNVMVGIIICHIEMDAVVKSHYIRSISFSHWFALEK